MKRMLGENILLVGIIFVLIACILCITIFNLPQFLSVKKSGNIVEAIYDPPTPKDFKGMGINTKLIPINGDNFISKDKAIQIAIKETYATKWKKVYAQKFIYTNEGQYAEGMNIDLKRAYPEVVRKGYAYRIPIWLISFEGIDFHRSKDIYFNETNVFVEGVHGYVVIADSFR